MRLCMRHIKRGPLRQLVQMAVCTALIFGVQVVFSPLPNLELVTLLFLLYTHWFGKQALLIVYAFVGLEILLYGAHLWALTYLYVWPLLWLIAFCFSRKQHSTIFWAIVGGGYGLLFGLLCTPVYFVTGGPQTAFAWWVAGIPFDIVHCCGNVLTILVLYQPLDKLYQKHFA